MATILGREGSVSFNNGIVAEIRSFEIVETESSYPNNVMGAGGWDSSVGGRKSWNASVECFYDPNDTTGHGGIAIGTEAVGEFFPEGDTTGGERRHGTCRVEERTIKQSEDNLVELSIKFKGVGPLNDAVVV